MPEKCPNFGEELIQKPFDDDIRPGFPIAAQIHPISL
jgi:hypothetical protein